VRLVPQPPADTCLPLLGKIAAGRPIEALANPEPIEVPSQLRTSRPCYVLKVAGESMREAGILDGDYVVIEQRDTAADGEIVVALIRGEEATLKRLLQRPDRVILYPENSTLSAQEYPPEDVQIQGVLVGQMRVYR
jgi:repressor LexA